jgi:uncharacterized protein
MRRITYLDSSAIVKLISVEQETGALRRFLHRQQTLASSALARVEVLRAGRQRGSATLRRARAVMTRISPVRLDDSLMEAAAVLDPLSVRTLDAIHLASAMACGEDLEAVVTYDARMRDAADALGLPVIAPA